MPKKSSKDSISFQEAKSKLKSFIPVIKNGWLIKFSTFSGENVLLVFMSIHTHQIIVRHYDSEDFAVNYINFVIGHDSTKQWAIE
jgi:hypothetical protein